MLSVAFFIIIMLSVAFFYYYAECLVALFKMPL